MADYSFNVTDYEGKDGEVEVSVGLDKERNGSSVSEIRLAVSDNEDSAIVYLTTDEAKEIALAILKNIAEIKNGQA